jgi:hypothetical protein
MLMRHLLVLALLLLSAPAAYAQPQTLFERWYAVRLMDRPVGWAYEIVTQEDDRITSSSQMQVTMKRGPTQLSVRMDSDFVETEDGRPIKSRTIQDMGSQQVMRMMLFHGDGIELITQEGDRTRRQMLPRPGEAWRPPAAAARYVERQIDQGEKRIAVSMLDPGGSARVIDMHWAHQGDQPVEVMGKIVPATLWLLTASNMPGITTRQFVDDDGHTVKTTVALMPGVELVVVEADEQLAKQQVDPPELMRSTLIEPDRPINNPRGARSAIYELSFDRPGDAPDMDIDLPRGGAQRVVWGDRDTARVVVDLGEPVAPGADVPGDEHRRPSAALDSEDPRIIELVEQAIGDEDVPTRRAELMRRFVASHIDDKDLSVGFATASEVARTRQGDCTEHAVLLAAMLRVAGIPSRTVSGVVYVDQFLGRRGVFGYHMWTQAWLDDGGGGRWIDLDAILDQGRAFDATHIALAHSAMADDAVLNDMVAMAGLIGRVSIRVIDVDTQ